MTRIHITYYKERIADEGKPQPMLSNGLIQEHKLFIVSMSPTPESNFEPIWYLLFRSGALQQ